MKEDRLDTLIAEALEEDEDTFEKNMYHIPIPDIDDTMNNLSRSIENGEVEVQKKGRGLILFFLVILAILIFTLIMMM